MAAIESPKTVGLRPFHEFDDAHDVWPRGDRPAAIREAAQAFRTRFKERGQIYAVRTIDLALARALDAGDMLNHARRADSDTERNSLIVNARPLTASSMQLQQEADQFLSSVVPTVVPQQ